MPRHEIDRLGSDEVRGDDDIALVFAILFVDQHDHAPGLQFGNDLQVWGKGHVRGQSDGAPSNGNLVKFTGRRADAFPGANASR